MSINHVSVEGNNVRDIEVRYTAGGMAVAGGAIAYNTRVRNKETNEWEDGEPSFFDFVCFGDHAENIATSVAKGNRVIVTGRLQQDTWVDKESGDKRSKVKIVADSVAPVLRWSTASLTKVNSNGGGGSHDDAFAGVEMADI